MVTPWRVAGLIVISVVCVLAVALWAVLKNPPEPDWRQAIADARAANDCERVFAVSSSAASMRVPGADDVWMQTFGAAALDGGAPGCAASWTALLDDDADAQAVEAFMADVQRFAESLDAPRSVYQPPGTLAVAMAALRGFEVLPGYTSGYRLEPVFAALSFAQRVRLAWLQMQCDAVWSIDKPNWRIVENDVRGDSQGAWQALDTQCGEAALTFVDDIGVDARGDLAQAVDTLLGYSGRLARSRYLSAHRLLVDRIVPAWAVGDADIVASLHDSAFSDLSYAVLDGHGPSMALYADMISKGVEQKHVERRMGVVFHDPDVSDAQYAFGLLTLAQAAGEDVSDDLARAAAGLSEAEQAAAVVWADGGK
ncbi:MAG: hypothetical protein Pyrs2KO_08860 [Pyruvatibacter sp.]